MNWAAKLACCARSGGFAGTVEVDPNATHVALDHDAFVLQKLGIACNATRKVLQRFHVLLDQMPIGDALRLLGDGKKGLLALDRAKNLHVMPAGQLAT